MVWFYLSSVTVIQKVKTDCMPLLIMAAIFLAQHVLMGQDRVYRNRINLWDISDARFGKKLLHRWQEFTWICDLIRGDNAFQYHQDSDRTLTVDQQLATTLRLLASGTFQNVVGDVTGIRPSSQSRSIAAVTDALADRAGQYINFWKYGTPVARKASFADEENMPNTLGCIDCTHVGICAPKDNGQVYVNRKGKHSIDVQVVVDLQLHWHEHGRMLARFYGTHDAFIWQNSLVTGGCCNQLWN